MSKADVAFVEFHIEDTLFELHDDLVNGTYRLGPYEAFYVHDPKRRHIHKASVRDRILHQAVFRKLLPFFESSFIFDSFSSREKKGTHLGVERLERGCRKITGNWTRPAYALKCDVQKFFDSIDHIKLLELIQRKVADSEALSLISAIVFSFEKAPGKGLPLGNVTSQLFANIYLHELDYFVKHRLQVRHYFRYCDDFVILDARRQNLQALVEKAHKFLREELHLVLHPKKVTLRKVRQGIDFLGYVVLPHYKVLRTKTKKRILGKMAKKKKELSAGVISKEAFNQSLQSYLGMLKHCKGRKIEKKILKLIGDSL